MPTEADGNNGRRLRIVTHNGSVDGQLRTTPSVSTLHYLNVAARSRSFVVMHPPIETSNGWNVADGALALALDSVIFVQEVSDYKPIPGDPAAAAAYERRAIRLSVGEYAVEGFLHVTPGANPIERLNQDVNAFFALSSVSALGPNVQFAAPFLAIKRSAVLAFQAVGIESETDNAVEQEMATTW